MTFARVLGSGHLLTWEGESHPAYGQTTCIPQAVDDYFIDLVLPRRKARPARPSPEATLAEQGDAQGEHAVADLASRALLDAEARRDDSE